jgi:hypothetical protein
MSTEATQALQIIEEPPHNYQIRRELEHIHKAMNDRLVPAATANLKVDYIATDVDTATEVAAELNKTNAKINLILELLRLKA